MKRLFTFSPALVMNDDDHLVFAVRPRDEATLRFLLDHGAAARWVEVSVLKPKTGALLMKLLFTNVRVTESRPFVRYTVFRAEIDRWHTLVQNVSEL